MSEKRTTKEDVNRILEKFCKVAGLPFAENAQLDRKTILENGLAGALFIEKINAKYYEIRQYNSEAGCNALFNNMSAGTLKETYERIFVMKTTLDHIDKFPNYVSTKNQV